MYVMHMIDRLHGGRTEASLLEVILGLCKDVLRATRRRP
jgi:hypothetical protein